MEKSSRIFAYGEKLPVEKSLALLTDKICAKLPVRDQDFVKELILKKLKNVDIKSIIDFENAIDNLVKQGSKLNVRLVEESLETVLIFASFVKDPKILENLEELHKEQNETNEL